MADRREGEVLPFLKPCPFCGGSPCVGDNEDKESYATMWFVVCDDCGARGSKKGDDDPWRTISVGNRMTYQSQAVAAWNDRQPCPAKGVAHADPT